MYCSFCGKSLPDTQRPVSIAELGKASRTGRRAGSQSDYHYQENPVPVDDSNPMQSASL